MSAVPQSRKVKGILRLDVRLAKWQARFDARMAKLLPLREHITRLRAEIAGREARLTGGQRGQLDRARAVRRHTAPSGAQKE